MSDHFSRSPLYISPTNYTVRESVPTWNYGAVHLYGNAQVFSSPEALQGILQELIQTFEPGYASQWASLNEAYRERMLRQIVGFEIEVTKIERSSSSARTALERISKT